LGRSFGREHLFVRPARCLGCRVERLSRTAGTLATPEPIKDWSLTSLKEKLIKIGAKVVSHGRYVAFQTAKVATHGKCSGGKLRREVCARHVGKRSLEISRTRGASQLQPCC